MKKLTKSVLVMMMSLLAMISCTMFVTMNVKANQTANPLTAIAFEMTDGASVRVALKGDGSADAAKTGIRFQAKMSVENYGALPQDLDLVYGILVTTLENAKAYPITTDNVFGLEPVYTFDAEDVSGAPKIVNVELDDLVAMDEDNDDVIDYYYMQASMVNIKSNDKEFVGVAYLKSTNENDEYIYDVKTHDVADARSMAYVAQIEMEKEDVDQSIKDALADTYLTGLSQDIEVAYKVKYDDNCIMEDTMPLSFPVGEAITTASVKTAFENALAEVGFVASNYTEGEHTLKVGGVDKGSAMIYANGKNLPEVTLNYVAKEAEETVYSDIAGYYITEDEGSVFLNADGSLVYNPDLGLTGPGVIDGCSYVLYADGFMSATIGQTCYGHYDAETLTASLEINEQIHEYVSSVEAPASVYANLRGYYEDEGNTNYVVLNANGTLLKNVGKGTTKQGSYVVSYDKAEEGFVLTSAMLDGATNSQEINLADVSVMVDGGVYALSTTKTLASEEDYRAFAKTYSGETPWVTVWGKGGSWDQFHASTETGTNARGDNKLKKTNLTFTEDGQLFYDGVEEFSGFVSGGNNIEALTRGTKNGNFVLFNDGTMKGTIAEISQLQPSKGTSLNKSYGEVEVTGTFDKENNQVTITIPNYRYYTINRDDYNQAKVVTDIVYTQVESTGTALKDDAEYMDKLYTDFSTRSTNADPAKVKTAYRTSYTAGEVWETSASINGKPYIEAYNSKKITFTDGKRTIGGTYTLEPITETFGEVVVAGSSASGYTASQWKMYYNYVNGIFTLRANITLSASGKYEGPGYNHFVDFTLHPGWYSSYDKTGEQLLGLPSMNRLVGEGTTEIPATKTFSSNGASITLENDGVGKIQNTVGLYAQKSGKATVNFGGEDKASTYSLVANSLTSGLIFIDLEENPTTFWSHQVPADRYIQGEYNLVDGKYVITFNYNGQDFYLVDGGAGNVYKGKVSGSYVCGDETLTLDIAKYGVEEVGGWSINAISANAGQITINGESGTYAFENGTVKLVINGKVYVKAYGTIAELYAKYAGTYTATYNSTKTMSIILDASGNLTAVIDGGTQKTGTYTFEIINGELSIVFDFELLQNDETTISANSGYYSVKISSPSTEISKVYTYLTAYNVYNYAYGTVNANDSFTVMFEGLSTSAINLVKQVAQA